MPHLWQLNDYHQAPACCKKPWTCHCITRLHSLEFLLRAVRSRRPLPSNVDTFKSVLSSTLPPKTKTTWLKPGFHESMLICMQNTKMEAHHSHVLVSKSQLQDCRVSASLRHCGSWTRSLQVWLWTATMIPAAEDWAAIKTISRKLSCHTF